MLNWPHAPPHRILEKGTYIVTAGTYKKQILFYNSTRLNMLYAQMLSTAENYNITFDAWALMANHYHIILSVSKTEYLKNFINAFHRLSSMKLNEIDNIKSRKVWYNFWESRITFQKSYLARINYVNKNPQHHGIIDKAENYHWCSEAFYKYNLDPAFVKTVNSFKYKSIKIIDNF